MPDDGIGYCLRVLWINSLGLEGRLPGRLITKRPLLLGIYTWLAWEV